MPRLLAGRHRAMKMLPASRSAAAGCGMLAVEDGRRGGRVKLVPGHSTPRARKGV